MIVLVKLFIQLTFGLFFVRFLIVFTGRRRHGGRHRFYVWKNRIAAGRLVLRSLILCGRLLCLGRNHILIFDTVFLAITHWFRMIVRCIAARLQPFMTNRFVRSHSFLWIPSVQKGEFNLISTFLLKYAFFTHSKHLLMKSLKTTSLQRNAWARLFEPGLRLRPFELVTHRGLHRESKKSRFRVAVLMRSSGGTPNTSMMQANCSTSFSPGNSG